MEVSGRMDLGGTLVDGGRRGQEKETGERVEK